MTLWFYVLVTAKIVDGEGHDLRAASRDEVSCESLELDVSKSILGKSWTHHEEFLERSRL
jgi:hypothetical protein